MSGHEPSSPARPLTPEDVLDGLERARDAFEAERLSSFAVHGVPQDCRWPATWVYHRDSALGPQWRAGMSVAEVEEHTAEVVVRRFPDLPSQALPATELGPVTLQDALAQRRSCRDFADRPVPLSDLAAVLQASSGVTYDGHPGGDVAKRAAPSGGALYPVETFLITLSVEGLPAGIYHYAPLIHEVTRLRPGGAEQLASFLPPGVVERPGGVIVVLTVRFARTAKKYVERGYRFALLEAGHIAQNVCTTAVARDLGSLCIGGFWDDPLNALLALVPDEEAAVYAVMLGIPAR